MYVEQLSPIRRRNARGPPHRGTPPRTRSASSAVLVAKSSVKAPVIVSETTRASLSIACAQVCLSWRTRYDPRRAIIVASSSAYQRAIRTRIDRLMATSTGNLCLARYGSTGVPAGVRASCAGSRCRRRRCSASPGTPRSTPRRAAAPRDELVGVPGEHLEHVELARGQLDLVARPGHDAGRGVHVQIPHLDDPRMCRGTTADEHPEPGEQLAEVERFNEVVICAVVEAADAVATSAASGQHQHRHPALAAPELLAHGETVQDRGASGPGPGRRTPPPWPSRAPHRRFARRRPS